MNSVRDEFESLELAMGRLVSYVDRLLKHLVERVHSAVVDGKVFYAEYRNDITSFKHEKLSLR
jgi:hypothetical protein